MHIGMKNTWTLELNGEELKVVLKALQSGGEEAVVMHDKILKDKVAFIRNMYNQNVAIENQGSTKEGVCKCKQTTAVYSNTSKDV